MLQNKAKRVITGFLEDDCNHSFMLLDYDKLNHSELEELVGMVDFEIEKNKEYWKLIDLQGCGIGNIEEEKFDIGDYDSITDRLYNYFEPYGIVFVNRFTERQLRNFVEVE